jgi:serine phosphatase RsbU (regulator of sigma subunit)
MSEEEVARPRGRRSGRSSYGGHGLGLGAKVGLLAAAATLVCVATAVFLSGPPRGEADEQLNAFGLEAASVLSAPDARWYRGGAGAAAEEAGGLGHYEKTFKDLFGKEGAEFWDRRFKELTQPIPREEEGTFQGQALQKEKKAFERTVERIRKSAGTGGAAKADLKSQLALVWNAMHTSEDGPYTVTAAWLRERVNAGKEGAWLSGNVGPNEVSYDWSGYVDAGSGFGWVDGTVQGRAVRIFTASIRGAKPADPMTGYVAVYRQPTPAGASALGLAMLLLGPLLVGLVAYAVANGHTKGIRSLAREIDRLGSSGDPDRQLHASGSEATTLARAVERMVSNLEFREKHDGDDLEEVVSREQKVAQEIHHTLISKNPPRLRDYEVETLFKPGFEIGGDHFEYFPIDETHLGIILLDTNVRGIPAALVMASAKSYVRAEAPGELSPATVLRRVNRQLAGELPPGRHVTALYVVLDTADGSATLASAGHLPLLVYRHQAGKMAKVNPEGIALGLDAGPVFDKSLQEGDIPIGVGDRIVLYTDGALRIQNAEGEEFGEQRFYGSVANEAPKNSQAFVNFVGATIDRFHLDVPQNDDITISTIKRLR